MEQIYIYATGTKRSGRLKIVYDDSGITAYHFRDFAETDLKIALENSKNIEGRVIDITPLVQKGFIRPESLVFKD